MLRFLAIACCLSVITPAEAAEPQRWALLVGVDDYNLFNDLKYAGSDAAALAVGLKQSGFDPSRTLLLHDKAAENRYRPFKANIEKQLDLILSLAGPDDLVVTAFFGHGLHFDGSSYLCPAEADDTRPKETLIAVDDVYKRFGACQAALKLLIVDACRNDPRPPGKRSATPESDLRNLGATFERPPDGMLVLTSCSPGQVSWEDPAFGHGVFTKYLLQGLAGEADGNRNGRVTLGELYDYTSSETKVYVLNRYADKQVPALKGEINGIFEFPRPGPAKEITNSVDMKLTLIPSGEFLMGSPNSDNDALNDEKPQHRVRIRQPFFLGQTEVTQGQWQAVMGTTPWRGKSTVQVGTDYPATYISWNQASEYCRKLSEREGKVYRLPTEEEWEYACRAGTTTKYSFSNEAGTLGAYAWYEGNASGIDEKYAHRVGQKRPNPWGLYDMHGNVWEWCSDVYDSASYAKSSPDDPADRSMDSFRVNRGGGWSYSSASCRSAYRHGNAPDHWGDYLGFRVALVP